MSADDYIASLQACRSPEDFLAVIDRYKDDIMVREQIEGRWGPASIGKLDQLSPERAAFWRGRFVGRWEAAKDSGWSFFPHRIDREALAESDARSDDDREGGGR